MITHETNPPVTVDNYDGFWHASDFTIALTATDDTGVNATYYRINNGPTLSVSANGQPLITSEGANNTLEYWSVDTAGNEELPHKSLTQIKLDKTTPTAWIQINNGSAYTNSTTVNLQLFAADAVSGVSQMRFSNDGGVWSSWEPYSYSKSWNLTAGDGAKNVFVQYKDLVDLTVTAYQIITLDMTNPIANAGQNQTVNTGDTVNFNASNSTDNTGIVSYAWNFGDGATGTGITATHVYSNQGTYTATLTVEDAAGNRDTNSVNITVQYVIPEFSPAAMLTGLITIVSALMLIFRRKQKSNKQR
jgi:PKD repeat protein